MLCITALCVHSHLTKAKWSSWSQGELPDQGKLQLDTGVSRGARYL